MAVARVAEIMLGIPGVEFVPEPITGHIAAVPVQGLPIRPAASLSVVHTFSNGLCL